jgi:ribonuclease HII
MASLAADLGHYERRLREHGFRLIAGVDEVGRGALAGPLVAAAVILPEDFDLDGIADSKLLTKLQRERAFERICAGAICRSMVKAMPMRIDRRGLHRSNISLLRRAVMKLEVRPDYVLTDGFPVRRMPLPHLSIKKGDAVTASVAAASIVAKVTRDRLMTRLGLLYPGYGFEQHKGYSVPAHFAALTRLGPTVHHRRSFAPVAACYGDPVEGAIEPDVLPLEI